MRVHQPWTWTFSTSLSSTEDTFPPLPFKSVKLERNSSAVLRGTHRTGAAWTPQLWTGQLVIWTSWCPSTTIIPVSADGCPRLKIWSSTCGQDIPSGEKQRFCLKLMDYRGTIMYLMITPCFWDVDDGAPGATCYSGLTTRLSTLEDSPWRESSGSRPLRDASERRR